MLLDRGKDALRILSTPASPDPRFRKLSVFFGPREIDLDEFTASSRRCLHKSTGLSPHCQRSAPFPMQGWNIDRSGNRSSSRLLGSPDLSKSIRVLPNSLSQLRALFYASPKLHASQSSAFYAWIWTVNHKYFSEGIVAPGNFTNDLAQKIREGLHSSDAERTGGQLPTQL